MEDVDRRAAESEVRWVAPLRFWFAGPVPPPLEQISFSCTLAPAEPCSAMANLRVIKDRLASNAVLASASPMFPHVLWHSCLHSQGWTLVPCAPTNLPFDAWTLQEAVDLWTEPGDLTDAEFQEAFDGDACAEWNKMKPDGTRLQGDECTRKWTLTRQANVRALLQLPYPRKVVLFAVKFLCCNTCESVTRVSDWLKCVRSASLVRDVELPMLGTSAHQ
jgi:hypothetical protein